MAGERALVLGPSAPSAALAETLRRRGWTAYAIPARRGLPGAVWMLLRGLVLKVRRRPGTLVSLSPPSSAHVVAALLGRRRARWIAHVDAPLRLRSGVWARFLDPRLRALRRADLVTAGDSAAALLHRGGVAVAHGGVDLERLADVVTEPAPHRGGRRLLLLGTLNTPHVEHLALAMRERGHDVVVAGEIAAAYPPSVLPSLGVPVRPLEIPAFAWLRRVAREARPDVVHANWLPSYGFLAAAMRLRPLVAMAWGSDVYGAPRAQLRKARYAVRHADVAMSDSQALVDTLVELGADREHTFLLNWGVDLARFAQPADRRAVRRQLGLGDGPVVLSPRALRPLYNPRIIVDAFEEATGGIPGAQLVLKHLEAEAPDLGRPLPAGARIVGHVPYEDLPSYYQAADVCVSVPNSDSSPRSVWEAMACGCACVVSDLPWVHELVEDGRHALVVPPERAAVAAALHRLLTEPDLAARIGASARELVERHRDQRVEMDRLAAVYRRLGRT